MAAAITCSPTTVTRSSSALGTRSWKVIGHRSSPSRSSSCSGSQRRGEHHLLLASRVVDGERRHHLRHHAAGAARGEGAHRLRIIRRQRARHLQSQRAGQLELERLVLGAPHRSIVSSWNAPSAASIPNTTRRLSSTEGWRSCGIRAPGGCRVPVALRRYQTAEIVRRARARSRGRGDPPARPPPRARAELGGEQIGVEAVDAARRGPRGRGPSRQEARCRWSG